MKALTTLLVIGSFATAVAMADDVDDVKAAVEKHYAALNAGDASALVELQAAGNTRFGPGGTLLERSDSLEELRKTRQAEFDAGLKYNLQARHIDVMVYGNLTALATWYGVGRIAFPDGTDAQVNNRITRVFVKQEGQWKTVHMHLSPLRGPQ